MKILGLWCIIQHRMNESDQWECVWWKNVFSEASRTKSPLKTADQERWHRRLAQCRHQTITTWTFYGFRGAPAPCAPPPLDPPLLGYTGKLSLRTYGGFAAETSSHFAAIKISWWYLKRFKSYHVGKRTPTDGHTVGGNDRFFIEGCWVYSRLLVHG